jgi:triacylglycerol lipase
VQAGAILHVPAGCDVVGIPQTGTGKTAAVGPATGSIVASGSSGREDTPMSAQPEYPEPADGRAVVIVSGGAAVSPFTTPTEACGAGLAAGNTDTYLREGLLAAGHRVFTSPARIGAGIVTEDTGWGGFSDTPTPLPAEMTVNSVGDIDEAGQSLSRFLGYLHESYGVAEIDIVAHSMGGLFSRAAIRVLREARSPLAVRTLTTIGTPWTGGFSADYAAGDIPLAECNGDPACEMSMKEFAKLVETSSEGAGEEVTAAYLAGPGGWNERQGDALAGIPVVVIGGDYFSASGNPQVWPNDGLVALRSALAEDVPETVLAARELHTFPDVHSIYFSHVLELEWDRALTWDPDVLALVRRAIAQPAGAVR